MKYSKEITDKICQSLKQLKGRINSCKEAGIHYDTFCEWMRKKSEFSAAIKKAESEAEITGKERAIMSIFAAMSKQWTAAAWWLERNFKEQFSQKLDHEHGEQRHVIVVTRGNAESVGRDGARYLPGATVAVARASIEPVEPISVPDSVGGTEGT